MHCQKTISLPLECLPALKGMGGQKVKDTQTMTNTNIYFKRLSSSVSAHIVGQSWKDVTKAEKIMKIAVNHFYASIAPPKVTNVICKDAEDTENDLRTFYFETFC